MSTAEMLADPVVRVAVVAELSRLSSVAERCGIRAVKNGNYKVAAANLQLSAWRERAAKALADGSGFDPRDRRHVEQAVASVRVRMREPVGLLSHADDARRAAE